MPSALPQGYQNHYLSGHKEDGTAQQQQQQQQQQQPRKQDVDSASEVSYIKEVDGKEKQRYVLFLRCSILYRWLIWCEVDRVCSLRFRLSSPRLNGYLSHRRGVNRRWSVGEWR